MRREVTVQLCIYLAIPSTILLAVLQSTVTAQINLFGASPDLVLLFVVSWALLRGLHEGLVVALVGGIMLDALSAAPFGLGTVALAAAGALAGLGGTDALRASLSLGNTPLNTAALRLGIVILATWVYNGLLALLLRVSGEVMSAGFALSRIVLPTALLNALFMLPVYGLVRMVVMRSRAEAPMEWQ